MATVRIFYRAPEWRPDTFKHVSPQLTTLDGFLVVTGRKEQYAVPAADVRRVEITDKEENHHSPVVP